MGLMTFLSMLTGCKGGKNGPSGTSTVTLAENATLTGLFMTHQGMAMEPFYILSATDSGCYMKITDRNPESDYFGSADVVLNDEHASLVTADAVTVREIFDVIVSSGALAWNGYNKHVSMKGVLDAGDSYTLFLKFSDGSTVKVNSYNSHPDGWNDFFVKVRNIFEAHEDYSRYRITELTEADSERLIVEFGDGLFSHDSVFKIDITVDEARGVWNWSLKIKDKNGEYLEAGTDIGLYREEPLETLTYGRIVAVLHKNGIEKWNGILGTESEGRQYMSVLISDKNGKTLQANANGKLLPADYTVMRNDFVQALIEFYELKK